MTSEQRQKTALEFLRLARAGDRSGAEQLILPGAKHHNPYFPAGMPALLDAIVAAAKQHPGAEFAVKHVVADDDYVAVHSHVRHSPGAAGIAVVHLFRFDGDRIAELWDVGQPVPENNPNADGMF